MDKYGLGNFLAQLRNEKGLTQEQLAEMINVNYKTISKWECGNSLPNLDILVKLCEIYDVSLYEMSIYQKITNPLISKDNIKKIISKKSIMKYTILKIFLIILITIIIMFATYSTIYTINNHNQIKVYELSSDDKLLGITGLLVKTHNNYYLSISKLEYFNHNDNITNDKVKSLNYSIIINDEIIENKFTNYDNNINIMTAISTLNIYISNKNENDIKDLKLKIEYDKNDGNQIIKTFKINLSQKYENNKLFY